VIILIKVQTRWFGEMEVNKDELLYFEEGIPGFNSYREYILIPHTQESPFFFLQSIKKSELCFILINPFECFQNYHVNVPKTVLDKLYINSSNSLSVFTIVNLTDGIEKATTNLQAPIFISKKDRAAVQVILDSEQYNIKENLFHITSKIASGK
jgi:flagellar assembly factor FliW